MFDSRIESLRRGIVSEPERGLSTRVHESGGAMEQYEAKCLGRLEQRQRGVLARPSPSFGPGLDLKIRQQVVRENHQLLPRTVGGICHRRHGVKRQAALELADGLFMIATTCHEVPEVGHCETEIARNGRILIVPIIRVVQIQLVIRRSPMHDLLSIDRDPKRVAPGSRRSWHHEAADVLLHVGPCGIGADVLLQV